MAECRNDQEKRAKRNCSVRAIERWPVPVAPVQIEIIHDEAARYPIGDVAQCAGHDQRVRSRFQALRHAAPQEPAKDN